MSNILVISGISWSDTYQRHQFVAEILAKHGHNIRFLEGVPSSKFSLIKLYSRFKNLLRRKHIRTSASFVDNNISIIKLPFLNPEFKWYNRRVIAKNRELFNEIDLVYTFLPIDIVFDLTSKYCVNSKVIYDCVRNFEGWGEYSEKTLANERKLLSAAQTVLVDSFFLLNKWKDYNPIQLLPTISSELFSKFKNKEVKLRRIKHIAYFGTFGKHCDIEIVNKLLCDGFIFHLYGVLSPDISFDNVNFINHGFYSDINSLMDDIYEQADAIIIPYNIDSIDGVIPAKLMQSLVLPIPTFISSFYDSKALCSLLNVYSDYDDLKSKITDYDYDQYRKDRKNILSFIITGLDVEFERKIIELIN